MPKNKNDQNIIIHHVDLTGKPDAVDMQILDFLPPELRETIFKEIVTGSGEAAPNIKNDNELEKKPEKIHFDFKMVNCNQNLEELTKKLKKSKKKAYGILLYGESGCGKSFYGKYLAQELKMPFIKKRASDLISKFVGDTEQCIRSAFEEAKQKKCVLILDECDSFLFDRKFAQRDFECASVNEMLTQMEDHPYPVILTSNLKDKLDPASMRRILFKVKYDYMTANNIMAGVKTYFGKKYKLTDDQLKELNHITAGDFSVIKNKMEILENEEDYSGEMIYEYLLQEQKEKNIVEQSKEITL